MAPPEPLPPGADPARFSAGRALGHLRVIAAAPRPLGSLHHGSVRDYLVEHLRRLDLEVEVQRASWSARVFGWIRGASVHNVVGRLRGRGEGAAVLLAAHYDTVPNSPGADDDGAGVAALLEAARALRAGPPLERDVIFLLTDAEELGLLGAMAFVAEHPWARDAFVALNFEARGVRGPSAMFEVTGNQAVALRAFGRADRRPVGNSLIAALAKLLPNDTDLTVLRGVVGAGLNFALPDGLARYHTPLDSLDNLDPGSLQHHGDHAVDIARWAASETRAVELAGERIYFDAIGRALISYPSWGAYPLAVALVVVFVAAVRQQHRRQQPTLWLSAAAWQGLGWLLALGVVQLAAALVLWAVPAQLVLAFPGRFAVGYLALAAAEYAAAQRWIERRGGDPHLGAAALWMIPALVTPLVLPGASYLFQWVVLLSLTQRLLGRHVPAAAPPKAARWGRTVLTAAVSIPPVFLAASMVYMVLVLDGGLTPAVPVAFAGLWVVAVTPAFARWTIRGRVAGAVACAAAGLLLLTGSVLFTGFDRASPRLGPLLYALSADTGQSHWITPGPAADPYLAGLFGPHLVPVAIPD